MLNRIEDATYAILREQPGDVERAAGLAAVFGADDGALQDEDVRACLGSAVFETVVPRNVRLSEAPSHGLPISKYDPSSRASVGTAVAQKADVDWLLIRSRKRFFTE